MDLSRLVYYFCSQSYSAQVEFVSPIDETEVEITGARSLLNDFEKLQTYAGSASPLMHKGFMGFAVRLAPRVPAICE